jgi:hypothetical protein
MRLKCRKVGCRRFLDLNGDLAAVLAAVLLGQNSLIALIKSLLHRFLCYFNLTEFFSFVEKEFVNILVFVTVSHILAQTKTSYEQIIHENDTPLPIISAL